MFLGDCFLAVLDKLKVRILFFRAGAFVAGQLLVQATTVAVGLLLLRVLSVEQYALYTIAGALLVVVSLGSNFGLGQAIVSLGSGRREDRIYIGALWNASRRFSSLLFPLSAIAVVLLGAWMFRGLTSSLSTVLICVALVLAIGYTQIDISLGRSVFNMHHDARAIFQVGIAEGVIRLALIAVCAVWPMAIVALAANLLATIVARHIALQRTLPLLDQAAEVSSGHRRALRAFVSPLVPGVLYLLFQGQIVIFILSGQANTQAIAEFGALSRLGQLFTVLMMLNPFIVQPVFARITSERSFLIKLAMLVSVLVVFTAVILSSTLIAPQIWLFLLGANYEGLVSELPIAIGTTLATIVGATLYTVVISRGETSGQSLSVIPCLGAQVMFVILRGIDTTWTTADALVLGLIPALVYALCQSVLLVRMVTRWRVISLTSAG